VAISYPHSGNLAQRLIPLILLAACATTQSLVARPNGSVTITNLPTADGTVFQVNDLNAAGQITGYFTPPGANPHAFLYDANGLVDLGTLGGPLSEGIFVNASGVVAGDSYLSDFEFHAFLSGSNGLIDLGTLDGGTFSTPQALNDSNQVAGVSFLADGSLRGFLYTDGAMLSVGTLGGGYSYAFGLNRSGSVVGESALTNGDIHAFLFVSNSIFDLGTLPGGNYSSAAYVNDAGVVVGQATLASGEAHAFLYSGNVMADLGTLGGTSSSAFFVNQRGQIIGGSTTAGEAQTHGFFYSNGTMADLETLGGTSSGVSDLNNLGIVVGNSTLADGTQHAFLWQNGQMVDLNTLLPAGSRWVLSTADHINDAGRIVGTGTYAGVSQPYILDLVLANNPPIAVAGPDQTVECPGQVTLDGSHSSDPDGDPLSFEWSLLGNVLGTDATLVVSLPLGTNVVTLKVTDPGGAVGQTNVVVRVVDTTPPTGTCPGPVSASSGTDCQAPAPNLVPLVVASDTCTPTNALIITQDPAPGTPLGLGSHTIMLTVTDGSSNQAACGVQFTVNDTTPPNIISSPGPVTVSVDTNCQAVVPNVVSGVVASDNCTPANQLVVTQNPAAGTPIGLGHSTIVLSVSDLSHNTSTTNVDLNVVDRTPPNILGTPGPLTVSVGDNCQAAVPNVLANVLVTDNCTPAEQLVLTQNPAPGTLVGTGSYTIVVTVADASGNNSTASVALSVVDMTPPTILGVPGPLTVCARTNCQGTVPNLLTNVLATDNCTPMEQLLVSQDPAAGTLLPIGSYVITVTVTDAAGNSSSAAVPLTIADMTPPVICSLTASPNVIWSPNHRLVPISVTANVVDNCDAAPTSQIVSVTCNETTYPGEIQITGNMAVNLAATRNGYGNGRVYTITVQSTDASGNQSTRTVTVSVPH
jgi:probable HAF family extracellular repeat protein